MRSDNIKLLRECSLGINMAEEATTLLLPHVESDELRRVLEVSAHTHRVIGEDISEMLDRQDSGEKEPPAIVKAMSRLKLSASMLLCESDARIACLMIDGCHMGIKAISKSINRSHSADEQAISLARRLVAAEEYLAARLRKFL